MVPWSFTFPPNSGLIVDKKDELINLNSYQQQINPLISSPETEDSLNANQIKDENVQLQSKETCRDCVNSRFGE